MSIRLERGVGTTGSSALSPSIIDAKGDLIAGTAADAASRLAVGVNDTLLTADSTQATGVKWTATPTVTALAVTGLTGAANPGRFVGVTVSGSPATGTFAVGDYVITRNGQLFVCTVAGTPGTWMTPTDTRDLLTSGEETMSRLDADTASAVTTTTGNLRLTYFTARKTETTTQVRVNTGTTAAAATPTLCRLGLYLIDSAGDGTLVASIANDTTLFAATSTAYTRSWSAPYAKTAGLRYALGILVVSGAATPTLNGATLSNGTEASIAPQVAGNISGQADLPASFSAPAGAAFRLYAAVLP